MLDFLAVQIRTILANAHGAASVLALIAGIFLAETLAHMLPRTMDAYAADRITRLTCFGVSSCMTFWLDATAVGFCLAITTGLAGPTLHQMGTRWFYTRYPDLIPKAYKP